MASVWRFSFTWLYSFIGCIILQTSYAQDSTATTNNSAPATTNTIVSNSTRDCRCGFLDPTTSLIYSDSIILYFNETNTSLPTDIFTLDTFANPYEKGWFVYYREAASPQNVFFQQGHEWNLSPSWLTLNITGYTPQHLVTGAQLQTIRQDIQYGSFRAFMRSPAPYAGGSALEMKVEYNETSSAALDLLNMDDSTDDACMQAIVSNQDPVIANGINYTVLEQPQYNIGPWDFWEWRMDWNKQQIDWFVGANKTHSEPTSNASLVDIPTAFYLKHWSNGDTNWMQGPPQNDSSASIGWIRLFFNSSMTTTSQINSPSCSADQLCLTTDWTLRVTTSHTQEQTVRWTPTKPKLSKSKSFGIILIVASLAFGTVLLTHALALKVVSGNRPNRAVPMGRPPKSTSPWLGRSHLGKSGTERSVHSKTRTSPTEIEMSNLRAPITGASSSTLVGNDPSRSSHSEKVNRSYSMTRSISEKPLLNPSMPASTADLTIPSEYHPFETPSFERPESFFFGLQDLDAIVPARADRMDASTADLLQTTRARADARDIIPEGSAAAANPGAKPVPPPSALPQARNRVDYLAGLVAVCSLLVSCTHFILTFVPSVIEQYIPQHYESENWARRTIEPFFFNEVWVGLFFTTSTRFLTSGYLRTGNLKTIAEKVVCRCPRLMIPITAVILFEYFLMDLGAVKWLEYIPSITWSTWPSTSIYTNFGYFVDETLQLFYLIPNAAPQLTWNYCTGVLWTIPVQLQNSWLVLLGVVIIRDIKSPWKRFGYYSFCIINHWYALSWGSYFWFGLLLADLDITYKYRRWAQARRWVHYPLLTLAGALVFLSLANDLFTIWTGYTFSTSERGIHPEPESARPLAQTSQAGYPPYTEPKLNGLVFAVASQYLVELSPRLQALLSTRLFLFLFPHVFTIYLIHGLIFWSLGSLACVYFAGLGLAFWLNILLTALICYAALFLCLPVVTPVIEMLGKEITKGIWVAASEEPAPWRPSSFPFEVSEMRDLVWRRDDEG